MGETVEMASTRRGVMALAAGAAFTAPLAAQEAWPNRPLRFIVPFIPGSAPDINARQLAEAVGSRIGLSPAAGAFLDSLAAAGRQNEARR